MRTFFFHFRSAPAPLAHSPSAARAQPRPTPPSAPAHLVRSPLPRGPTSPLRTSTPAADLPPPTPAPLAWCPSATPAHLPLPHQRLWRGAPPPEPRSSILKLNLGFTPVNPLCSPPLTHTHHRRRPVSRRRRRPLFKSIWRLFAAAPLPCSISPAFADASVRVRRAHHSVRRSSYCRLWFRLALVPFFRIRFPVLFFS